MITTTAILDVYALGLAFLEAGRHHGDWAVDSSGRAVAVASPRAVRFCLVGALERAAYELGEDEQPGAELVLAAVEQLQASLSAADRVWPEFRRGAYNNASAWWELRGTLPAARAIISDAAHRLSSK